jgi:VWFA-related protein
MRIRVLVFCLLASVAWEAWPQAARDVVTDEIAVTVVEVPVHVLRNGEPVAGLTAADFEVFDRGVRREIVDFDRLDLTAGDSASDASADARTAGRRREPRERHLLLLVDFDLTDWRELPRALRGVREILDGDLHPSDRLSIGFLSPALGVQRLHAFTTDREASRAALDVLEAMTNRDPETAGAALERLAERTDIRTEGFEATREGWQGIAAKWIRAAAYSVGNSPLPQDQALGDFGSGAGPRFDDPPLDPVQRRAEASPSLYDEQTLRRLLFLGKALRDLARSLADLPEPKQMILLSAGVPSRFLDSRSHATRVLARLDLVIKACLETGWVVQAVDIRGVPSIDEPAFDGNSLFHLARHTGGQLYENFNDVGRAAGRILDRSRLTYILVIQPDVEADGSFHDLEVRLKPSVRADRVHHRPGYRAPTPAGRRANLDDRRDVARLALGEEPVEDFEIALLALPGLPLPGRASVPVIVEVPGEILLENPFGGSVSVEVHGYGLDPQGGVADLFIKRLDFDLQRAEKRLRRGGLRVVGRLNLGTGDNEVRVLVRNLATDAISVARSPVRIPNPLAETLAVFPPLFMDQSRNWVSVTVSDEEPEAAALRTIGDTLGEDFYPDLEPHLRRARVVQMLLGMYFAGAEPPRLQIRVLTPLGKEVDGARIRVIRRFLGADGATGLVATLQPKDLQPGGYLLEVALVDERSGGRVTSTSRFVVEESP